MRSTRPQILSNTFIEHIVDYSTETVRNVGGSPRDAINGLIGAAIVIAFENDDIPAVGHDDRLHAVLDELLLELGMAYKDSWGIPDT